MEPPNSDTPKLPDMVMCGDHPSFTKTELNVREDSDDNRKATTLARVSPSSSHTAPGPSEHGLRLTAARRRVRSMDRVLSKPDTETLPGNRALVQAALGSFRWPPYLLCIWVLVLVFTHAIHCTVTMLERALPNIKKLCAYFRSWTEEAWLQNGDYNQRLVPIGLALLTGLLYTLYCTLYVFYSIVVWSIEPLCPEVDDKTSACEVMDPKITNYVDDANVNVSSKTSKTNCTTKH